MLAPFVGTLACNLETGNAIFIAGKTLDCARKLTINLRHTKDNNSDIELQLKALFRKGIILRNTRINNEWGDQEVEDNISEASEFNPIAPGEFFIVSIFVGDTHFHVSINHRPFCSFKIRGSLKDIRVVEIRDHIQAVTQVDHRTIFPAPWPVKQISDPRKAFSNDIPILFTPGHVVVITAMVWNNNKGQFIIQFTELDSEREGLHFNPRFDSEIIVRNVRKTTKDNFLEYGIEDREGGFPLKFDRLFCLAIAFTEKEFKFAIDGTYFSSFSYYTPELLQVLNGFKIVTNNGLLMQVFSVDHIKVDNPDCDNFEKYSSYRFETIESCA